MQDWTCSCGTEHASAQEMLLHMDICPDWGGPDGTVMRQLDNAKKVKRWRRKPQPCGPRPDAPPL